ncbi:GIY-YIG nuclease family protein [Niabella beijingensis]|uniref:GIY-YIG nuclease family protein n=1 Tax=Niabella beijingensis TaxID=2872700 RepID=UPI001CBC72C2|nr:GIY-YIG nuclease family protein [Niabella beijingensis]
MAFYVYIIRSVVDNTYYNGSTQHPVAHLQLHNQGQSLYTKSKVPWIWIYVEELPSKRDMLIREKKLKRGNAAYFHQLINGWPDTHSSGQPV